MTALASSIPNDDHHLGHVARKQVQDELADVAENGPPPLNGDDDGPGQPLPTGVSQRKPGPQQDELDLKPGRGFYTISRSTTRQCYARVALPLRRTMNQSTFVTDLPQLTRRYHSIIHGIGMLYHKR